MNTYTAVKNRILSLCEEKHFTINKLATESGVGEKYFIRKKQKSRYCDFENALRRLGRFSD